MSQSFSFDQPHKRNGPGGAGFARLKVALLGPPTCSWIGRNLKIPRRQVRALFYRLATHLQPVTREELCLLFWPEETNLTARRNLTHLLTHLRRALPSPELVYFSNDDIGLDSGAVWSDTAAFDESHQDQLSHLDADQEYNRLARANLETMEAATSLYRGHFLHGFNLPGCFEFEAWVIQQRQEYECRYLEKMLELIEYYQLENSYEKAITFGRRYLAVDPLAESVHCKLIELYAGMGDISAAERQFELCTATLERELGASPSPKTWSLYQSIQTVSLPVKKRSFDVTSALVGQKFNIPFIGREAALTEIEKAYKQVYRGSGRVILIEGEPGIGKSCLLLKVIKKYQCQATILFSVCSPGMMNLPFHAIAEAFRPVLDTVVPKLRVNPIWLAEAARLLPEIYTLSPNLPSPFPAKPEEARRRLFEALYQLAIGPANNARPVLLCLDNLHWADTTTVEWLIYAGSRAAVEENNHLMIIGTIRSEDAHNLAELRMALLRLGILREYLLEGLEIDEIAQILHHILGSNFKQSQLADRLHQISGGNPFFLLEALGMVLENHSVPEALSDLDQLSIPKTAKEAIRQRMVGLNRTERKILDFNAVFGLPVSLDRLKIALDSNELEILEGLETLLRRNLLNEQNGRYIFQHEMVRSVIYDELGYDRRRYLHCVCGKILEDQQPEMVALLARHFEQGGESRKAAQYALQAGENSSKVNAYQEALDFFSRALDLLKQEAVALRDKQEIDNNYRMQILALSRRGSMFRSLGEMQSYQNNFEEEGRIARALGDEIALAYVQIREAYANRWFCRYPQARDSAKKALTISRKAGNELLEARALLEIGLAARAAGDFPCAQEHLGQALIKFSEIEETGYEVQTYANLSELHNSMQDFRHALHLAGSGLGLCEEARLPHLRRIPLGNLGVAFAGLGELEQGRESLLESLEISRKIADHTQEIFCLCQLGWLENRSGQPEKARIYFRDGLALSERLDSRSEQSLLYSGISETHQLLGSHRLAKALAQKALELAQRHGRLHDQQLAARILSNFDAIP